MFDSKKAESAAVEEKAKPTPAFLRADYPYQAAGEAIQDMQTLEDNAVYEIKCRQCEMSIRSQSQNIGSIYERLQESGCVVCGNKDFIVKKVDMSKASEN